MGNGIGVKTIRLSEMASSDTPRTISSSPELAEVHQGDQTRRYRVRWTLVLKDPKTEKLSFGKGGAESERPI